MSVREWRDVSAATFHNEILPSQQPALIRGAVLDWPAVRAGASPQALANYLRGFDTGASAETMHGSPAIRGRFFYNDDLTGLNFERSSTPLARSLDRLIELIDEREPPALYIGALAAPSSFPGFAQNNPLALLPGVVPRLWLSNRVTVQTHYDISYNIACVVGGRRRFTLFPPDQRANLYVGPLEFTLAGQPISMVRLDAPDHERFPRFRDALPHAQVAEMEPGDALFIPYMWWHHVEALDAFNLLVNYWWDDTPPWNGSPFEALCHALMSVHSLPPEKRAIWRKVFEHHIFETDGSPVDHLQPAQRGIQGAMDQNLALRMRAWLIKALTPPRRR
jgi:hypothetical protein